MIAYGLDKKGSGEQSKLNFDVDDGMQELRRKSRGKDSADDNVGLDNAGDQAQEPW